MSDASVGELAALIANHISYDGSVAREGLKCPHCGKMAREEILHHWIDHRSVLEGQIIRFLKLTPRVAAIVGEVLEDFHSQVSGNPKRDGRAIAQAIWTEIYGTEPQKP